MDKRVLLVLFSLQVFLLITAFTSTDAAALVSDDQRPQAPMRKEVSEPDRGKDGKKVEARLPGCWWRLGACSLFGKAPTTKSQLPDVVELLKKKKQPVLQN
ncbi:uncharacterized protein PEZ65_012488 isoform 2-T2 [Lycodopsis pacificus]